MYFTIICIIDILSTTYRGYLFSECDHFDKKLKMNLAVSQDLEYCTQVNYIRYFTVYSAIIRLLKNKPNILVLRNLLLTSNLLVQNILWKAKIVELLKN